MTQQKILLASFQNGPIPKKKLSQTKPNWTQRNLKTRHDVPVWGMFRIHTGRERKINKITFYFFEKMSIWGPQVQRRTDDNGLSFFSLSVGIKTTLLSRGTPTSHVGHICGADVLSVRAHFEGHSRAHHPGKHTQTHTWWDKTHPQNLFPIGGEVLFLRQGGGRKWVVLIKAQPYVALEEVKKKRKKKKL